MPHSLFLPAEEPLPAALSVQFSAASGRHGGKANHIKKEALKNQGFFAAPDRIRTCGLSVRSRTLYPLSYGCVRAVFQPVFLFYMESWKMSIPFPLFPFVKSSFILNNLYRRQLPDFIGILTNGTVRRKFTALCRIKNCHPHPFFLIAVGSVDVPLCACIIGVILQNEVFICSAAAAKMAFRCSNFCRSWSRMM